MTTTLELKLYLAHKHEIESEVTHKSGSFKIEMSRDGLVTEHYVHNSVLYDFTAEEIANMLNRVFEEDTNVIM